ncbi:uncharacterized protein [Dermacentor albipictus]|uniref:uncharacterized protein n=1 Tax=Dermacentor albipictus TaxID=60249 RepID=UPI0031FDEAAD
MREGYPCRGVVDSEKTAVSVWCANLENVVAALQENCYRTSHVGKRDLEGSRWSRTTASPSPLSLMLRDSRKKKAVLGCCWCPQGRTTTLMPVCLALLGALRARTDTQRPSPPACDNSNSKVPARHHPRHLWVQENTVSCNDRLAHRWNRVQRVNHRMYTSGAGGCGGGGRASSAALSQLCPIAGGVRGEHMKDAVQRPTTLSHLVPRNACKQTHTVMAVWS